MIDLRNHLLERGIPLEKMSDALLFIFQGNSFSTYRQCTELNDLPIDTLIKALVDYLDLCKEWLLCNADNKIEMRDLLEVVEMLGGVICALNIYVESKKHLLPDYYNMSLN